MLPEEKKKWLLSLSEKEASELDRSDWHDRIRLLRQIEGANRLKNIIPLVEYEQKEKPSYKPYIRLKKVNDYWKD